MNPQQLIAPGELFASSWAFMMKHWKMLGSIIAVPVVCVILAELVGFVSLFVFSGNILEMVAVSVVLFVIYIFALVLAISMYPAVINAIHRLSTEENPILSIKGQYIFGLKKFWSVVLVLIIAFLSTYGSFGLLIVPGIIFMVYALFHLFTLIVDDKRGLSAFSASFDLVKGQWWATFGRVMLLAAVIVGAALCFEFISFALSVLLGPLAFVVVIVCLVLLEIAMAIYGSTYMYKLYTSLKSLRPADAPTSTTIKPWTIAFMIIGVFVFIAYVFVMASIALSSAQIALQRSMQSQLNDPRFQAEFQRALQQEAASSTGSQSGSMMQ
jgi:hypothetical protein